VRRGGTTITDKRPAALLPSRAAGRFPNDARSPPDDRPRGRRVGDNPDVLAFDTALRRLYVAAESGEVALFAEHGRALTKLGQSLLVMAPRPS
jgi:hypothetical protein